MTAKITATVSIGRGAHAAQQPLSDAEWDGFRGIVATLLTSVADGTLHVDSALSTGEWNGEPEESATFVAEVPVTHLAVVRSGLRLLAQFYGQEAIALTLGHTEFITP
jgi:hypothetical protein